MFIFKTDIHNLLQKLTTLVTTKVLDHISLETGSIQNCVGNASSGFA